MKFEPNKTYKTQSICDADCFFSVTVASRTAKTIKTTKGKSLRIFIDFEGREAVRPLGRYSMAPIISAK